MNNADTDQPDVESLLIAGEEEEIIEEEVPTSEPQPQPSDRSSASSSSSSPKNKSPNKPPSSNATEQRKISKSSAMSAAKPSPVVDVPVRRSSDTGKKLLQWKVENDRLKKERNAAVNEKKVGIGDLASLNCVI